MTQPMGRVGSCFDSAASESWNSTLEFEFEFEFALLSRQRVALDYMDTSCDTMECHELKATTHRAEHPHLTVHSMRRQIVDHLPLESLMHIPLHHYQHPCQIPA